MAFHARAQGSTEYLILLAVVLIVALVSIALLGFFPGIANDAKITQSSAYWKSARPFAILSHSFSSNGTGTVIMQNTEADGTLTLTNISFGANLTSGSYSFAPGESRSISVRGASGTSGLAYDFQVNITYTTSYGVASKQYGSKTLTGKYL